MSNRSGARGRSGRAGRLDVVQTFQAPKQSVAWQVVSTVIRARAELFVVAVAVVTVVWLRSFLTPTQSWAVMAAVVLLVVALPWSRRFVVARVWCVLDRHRLRACLRTAKVRTMNLDGSLPFMLWARPTKTGERVWLWIRAGSSGSDIEDALEYIAPACLARSARLHRVRWCSTVVAVEVIRRDPLARASIPSPLAKLTARLGGSVGLVEGTEPIAPAMSPATSPVVVPMGRGAVVPSPRPASNGSGRRSLSAVPAAPVVVVNGEDLSDYVD